VSRAAAVPTTGAPRPGGAAPAAEPGDSGLSQRRITVVFVTILLGILLSALDQTIVSTALPTIVGDLGGSGHQSWVATSYILTETIATVLAGKLGDLFGRKTVFAASTVIFVVFSGLCGIAGSMTTLIVWRALQGIGAGGLTVTATALIGDLIPLRQRGKYQGALGAVFGVTTVVGPLLGGVFTDDLSWRWAFYVNLPIGILVIILTLRNIPSSVRAVVRPVIDYLGIAFVTVGAGGLVLATSLGGSSYAWTSPVIIGLYAVALVAVAVFIRVELRAKDPMLPMRLFRGPVFSVTMILAFVVGFAMLGAITFLPTYLQYVQGVSATSSGLRTLPMVIGLLITSIAAGTIVGRTGRYKIFPVSGTLLMAIGLFLLSRLGVGTGFWTVSASMFVLGFGIGLSMQVLTIIVQNTARYADLGVATSAVTFFRTLGSSFGTAVFGALYSNALDSRLAPAVAASTGIPSTATSTPEALHAYPTAKIAKILEAYSGALHVVFLYAVPVAGAAFVVSLFLKEVPLRGMARGSAPDLGDGFGMPGSADPQRRLETAVGRLLRRSGRAELPGVRDGAGSTLGVADGWCVAQVRVRRQLGLPSSVDAIAGRVRVPAEVLRPAFNGAVNAGYLTGPLDVPGNLDLTPVGAAESDKVVAAVRAWIVERLGTDDDLAGAGGDGDGVPLSDAALDRALGQLARRLLTDEAPALHSAAEPAGIAR
jgi:EmrB/QacA subfamily drug resistance transporter